MKLLKEKGYSFNSLIRRGGPLFTSFKEISDVCEVSNGTRKENLPEKFKRKLLKKNNELNVKPLLTDVDCIISNTITNGEILSLIKKHFKGPVISYIHELETGTILNTTEQSLHLALGFTNHFVVPCKTVKNFLHEQYKIPEQVISLINSYIPPATSQSSPDAFKRNKKISASFVVGTLGTPDWRKGMDIFILVASRVFQKIPDADIQFVWMGGKKNSIEHIKMLHDIDRLQLNDKIILIPAEPVAELFLKSINLFLLPSREDPYPLVMLEAAREKIPGICFNKGGGAPEFVGKDAGTIVEYLDIPAMAEQIVQYYCNRELLRLHGAKAYDKMCIHHDKNLIAHQFFQVLNSLS